jgi:hypothetical protein
VDAYRHEAVKRNKKRRTPVHFMAVGAGIAAGAYLVLVALVLIIVACLIDVDRSTDDHLPFYLLILFVS